MYVLDTNVLIYYTRDEKSIVERIERWLATSEVLVISSITEAEFLSWPELAAADYRIMEDVLTTLNVVPVDSSLARIAAAFRREYRAPLLDSIIAATAFVRNAPLVTRNTKDFRTIKAIDVMPV